MTQKEIDDKLKWYKKTGYVDSAYNELMYKIEILQKDYPFRKLLNKDGTINKQILEKNEDLQILQEKFMYSDYKTAEIFKGMTEKQIEDYGGEAMSGLNRQEKVDLIDTMNRLKKEFVELRRLESEQLIETIQGADKEIISDSDRLSKIIEKNRGITLNQLQKAIRNA